MTSNSEALERKIHQQEVQVGSSEGELEILCLGLGRPKPFNCHLNCCSWIHMGLDSVSDWPSLYGWPAQEEQGLEQEQES